MLRSSIVSRFFPWLPSRPGCFFVLLAVLVAVNTGPLYAQELAKLSHIQGVSYVYVDENNEPVPGQLRDDAAKLTDKKRRLNPVGTKGTIRVIFDFATPVQTQRIEVTHGTAKTGPIISANVLIGETLDALRPAKGVELEVKADNAKYSVATITFDAPAAQYVRVDLGSKKGVLLTELEVFGDSSGVVAIKGAGGSKMIDARRLIRDEKAREGMASGDFITALAAGLNGVEIIKSDWGESRVRNVIAGGRPGDVFFIEPHSSWVLTATLKIPEGISIYSSHPNGGRGVRPTFIKGFDGDFVHLARLTTLQGLYFDGDKANFSGHGIVAGGDIREGIREVIMTRVEVRNCRGHGYFMTAPHYYSEFTLCTFDRNDGYGIVYGEVRTHHTDNVWNSVHVGWNGKGGVAFYGVEASSIFENAEFFHNGGPAFEHFQITKKLGHGKERGPRPSVGASAIVIRNSVIRNHAGPVWLNRGGVSESIVFADSRLKHNGRPNLCELTKAAGQNVEEMFGLTGPVSGLFHVEGGKLNIEIRNGFNRNNNGYIFTTSPSSMPGSRLMVSGASNRHTRGNVYAPNGYITVLDTASLDVDVQINVAGGIGLDPINGKVVSYGPLPETVSKD